MSEIFFNSLLNKLRGILFAPSICLLIYSDSLLTSIILIEFNFKLSTKDCEEMDSTFSSPYLSFQLLKPPSKYPMQLSYPTLESLVIASISFPFSDINNIF